MTLLTAVSLLQAVASETLRGCTICKYLDLNQPVQRWSEAAKTHPSSVLRTEAVERRGLNVHKGSLLGREVNPSINKFGTAGLSESQGSDILFLTIGNSDRYAEDSGVYRFNRASWGCYGNKWGIPFRYVDPDDVPSCPKYKDWYFRRLCTVATIVESFSRRDVKGKADSVGAVELGLVRTPKWIIHLDGDSIVFNYDRNPHDIVQAWGSKDLVFYERFRNGELMAGNYALRTSPKAAEFLRGWQALDNVTEHIDASKGFSNSDNGALHYYMLSYLKDELQFPTGALHTVDDALSHSMSSYLKSHDIASYDRYVASVKLALGPKRTFNNVLILRRGHGFCVDDLWDGVTSLNEMTDLKDAPFVCMHGGEAEKKADALVQSIGDECISSLHECKSSVLSCKKAGAPTRSLREAIAATSVERMGLGQVNDVAACWPHCSSDLSSAEWQQLEKGLQSNAFCADASVTMGCCCLKG